MDLKSCLLMPAHVLPHTYLHGGEGMRLTDYLWFGQAQNSLEELERSPRPFVCLSTAAACGIGFLSHSCPESGSITRTSIAAICPSRSRPKCRSFCCDIQFASALSEAATLRLSLPVLNSWLSALFCRIEVSAHRRASRRRIWHQRLDRLQC